MADFNAGSIEGTLDLDTDPFVHGLRLARFQAEQFENSDYTATLRTKYETDGDAPDKTPGSDTDHETTATVKADDSRFQETLAKDDAELTRFGKRKVSAKADVDTNRARSALRGLEDGLRDVNGAYKKGDATKGGGSGHGMLMLLGLAASLAPALAPAIPAIALFGSAAVAAFGGAAVSLGLYAAVAHGAFTQLSEAIKNGEQLSGTAGVAETALKGLTSAWADLHKAVDPGVFELLATVFNSLQSVLPKLVPLIDAMSKGLIGAFQPLNHLLAGRTFEHFLALLSSNAIKDLPMLGKIMANIFGGLMHLFTALNPVIQQSLHWFVGITNEFRHWSKFEAPSYIHDVFGEVKKEGPALLHMLGSILSGVANIAHGFAPLVHPATVFLTGLGDALGKIDLGPLAKGFGDILVSLTPFLGMIADLVNVLLPPLGALLSDFAGSFIDPLASSLETALTPAFQGLADILDYAEPYIDAIIRSFANLLNPTGVGVLNKLFAALGPVIRALIPPVTNLVLALEGMIDQFLTAIAPAIAPAGQALVDLVNFLTPAIDKLAWFVGHPEVAVALVGIAAGFEAISLAISAISGIGAVIEGLVSASAAFDAIGISLTAMLGPVGVVLLVLAALGIGFYEAYKHSAAFRDAIGEIGDWIQAKVFPALKQLGDYLLNTTLPALIDLAKTVGKDFLPVLKQFADTFQSDILPVLRDFGQHLEKWWPTISKIIVLFAKLEVALVKVWAWVETHLLTAFIKWVGFVAHELLPLFDNFLQAMNYVVKGLGYVATGLTWLVDHAKDVPAAFHTAVEAVQNFPANIKAIFEFAKDWLVDKGTALVLGLLIGARNKWLDLQAWLGEREDQVKHFFTGAKDWLHDAGVHVLLGLLTGARDKYVDLAGWLHDRKAAVTGFFDNAVDWLHDKGVAVVRGLSQGISEKWADVKTWLQGVGGAAGTIVGAIGDLGDLLHGAGVALIHGLWAGIDEEFDRLKDHIGALTKWLKDHKGPIEYDRTLWREPGRALVEGLINGLNDMMPDLHAKVGNITDMLGVNAPSGNLRVSNGAAMAQANAISDLTEGFGAMVRTLVETLHSEGSETRAMSEADRQALIDALEGHAATLVANDRSQVQNLITTLRKG